MTGGLGGTGNVSSAGCRRQCSCSS